ncbi:MAG: C10 family peptidase [Thermodesulfovibrionales bacterium]
MRYKISFFMFCILMFLCFFNTEVLAISFNTLYSEDSSSNLYTINASTGAATMVGSIGISGVTDIAFNGLNLYGITFSYFLNINPNTATGNIIGYTGYSNLNALAVSSNGIIYAAETTGTFVRINPTSGQAIFIGNYGDGLSSGGDLAFSLNKTLYASVKRSGYDNSWLATVNLSTGKASLIGDMGYKDVYGLSFKDGTLYGVTQDGKLIKINTSIGTGTYVGSNLINHWGLTTSPSNDSNDTNTSAGLLDSSWGQRGPYVYTEKEDYNKNGTYDNYVFGCTAVAVGQLINYYLQHGCLHDQGCRDGWLEVMLQGIKVNPLFCNSEGKKCKKLKPNLPQQGYVTKTNYFDLITNDESQEVKDLKDFLWNVAMGLDSIFSEKSTVAGEKNFVEEFIIVGNKLSKLLSDRYRFRDIMKWSPKAIKRLDLAKGAIKYYIDNRRPVLFTMDLYVEGNKKKIGHAALIDGYDESPGGDFKVKINWGWANLGNENNLLYNTDGPIEVKYTEIKNNEQKQQNLEIKNFRIYGAPVPINY